MAGVNVVWAANHWEVAVRVHADNHPQAIHLCQDLHQADWTRLPAHDLLLAAPCCQGHTNARGNDLPHHDASRATAWAVVSALEVARSPLAIIENVPGLLRWPLWPVWCEAMRVLGYSLEIVQYDAADAGVPQNRVRLFIVATRSRAPIQIRLPRTEHRGMRDIVRWSDYQWRPVAEKCLKTQARVARGRAALGDRFVMPYYGSGSGLTGRSLDRPIGTITTRARWGVVDGDRQRMLQPSEVAEAMSFPTDYRLPTNLQTANKLLGNAVCPRQAEAIIRAVLEAA